jgi:hypothetical protein
MLEAAQRSCPLFNAIQIFVEAVKYLSRVGNNAPFSWLSHHVRLLRAAPVVRYRFFPRGRGTGCLRKSALYCCHSCLWSWMDARAAGCRRPGALVSLLAERIIAHAERRVNQSQRSLLRCLTGHEMPALRSRLHRAFRRDRLGERLNSTLRRSIAAEKRPAVGSASRRRSARRRGSAGQRMEPPFLIDHTHAEWRAVERVIAASLSS